MSYDTLHKMIENGVIPREPWSTIHLDEFGRSVVMLADRLQIEEVEEVQITWQDRYGLSREAVEYRPKTNIVIEGQ